MEPMCWGNHSAPVTFLTLAIGLSNTYMSILHQNRLSYVAQHGFEYCEYNQTLDWEHEPTWSKVGAALHLLEDPLWPRERVQWLDADALIMNMKVSLVDDLLKQYANMDAVFSADFPAWRDEVSRKLNAGSMHLRNTPWTRNLLRRLYTTSAGRENPALALLDGHYEAEQSALMQARDADPEDFRAHVAVVPWNVMNTLGLSNYCEGDFVLHAAGGNDRLQSYVLGHYSPKWGRTDKYQQLEEFVLQRAAEEAVQRFRPSSQVGRPQQCRGVLTAQHWDYSRLLVQILAIGSFLVLVFMTCLQHLTVFQLFKGGAHKERTTT